LSQEATVFRTAAPR